LTLQQIYNNQSTSQYYYILYRIIETLQTISQ